uniref:Basal cell adhesion molecule n=1 Tax=Jaculus jaculus TaxID=51337 RepID=A0A8C5KU16_JACJA
IDASGKRHLLASAEKQGSELQSTVHDPRGRRPPYKLDSHGRLGLPDAQVGDARDYVCVVKAGAAGTSEATARVHVFAKPEPTEVTPNKGTLSVMEESPQEIATCSSRNGNPVPQITWYRNGQRLEVPTEMNPDGYMTSRTVREASGLHSLTSTLYLRLHKADREATYHCAAHYSQPSGQHGRLDSPAFHLTLHDGKEAVLNVNLEGNLTLEGVRRGQSGTYGCRVEDYDAAEDVQLDQTLELRVAYLDPLELSASEKLLVFLNSSRTVVNCSARGLPAPTVRWTKDSVPLEDGPVLSLGSVTFDSAGTYTCEASTPTVPLLSRTESFQLMVQGSPELSPQEMEPRAGDTWTEGDEVRLVCSARGYPEPKLTWSQGAGTPAEPPSEGKGWISSSLTVKVTSTLAREGVSCEASNIYGKIGHAFHFGAVAPQTAQAGVAVMAVAVSVGLLLLVVAAFYCMRRKGRPGCCGRAEKAAPPPGEPELSQSGSEQPEQTGLLMGGPSGGARSGSRGFGDEC